MNRRPQSALIQGPYCPIPKLSTRRIRLGNGKYVITEQGLEQLCRRCGDYWPADTEFFFGTLTLGLHDWCRACYCEWRWPARYALRAAA